MAFAQALWKPFHGCVTLSGGRKWSSSGVVRPPACWGTTFVDCYRCRQVGRAAKAWHAVDRAGDEGRNTLRYEKNCGPFQFTADARGERTMRRLLLFLILAAGLAAVVFTAGAVGQDANSAIVVVTVP